MAHGDVTWLPILESRVETGIIRALKHPGRIGKVEATLEKRSLPLERIERDLDHFFSV